MYSVLETNQSEDIKKNKILSAAHACFSKRGFDTVTMDEIAREAGLSKGAVYWYFKSKDELILELIKNWIKLGENVLYKLSLECPLEELIYKYPTYVIRELQLQHHYRLIFYLWSRSMENDAVYQELRKAMQEGRKKAIVFIQTAIERGFFKTDITPESFARMMDALFDGLMVQWHFNPALDIEKQWKESIDMLMAGIRRTS
ncbi:TetR/AcrR family transcriptional regulator [bacterium]|nr:TetR/AcrR family transcriptional regulator [bacterium]NUN44678.1 TetR/AcrR family transcriptional regulator [bacterium]